MVCLIAPVTNNSDVQDSQKLGSVRLDARSGTQDLSTLGPHATTVYCEADDRGGRGRKEGGGRTSGDERVDVDEVVQQARPLDVVGGGHRVHGAEAAAGSDGDVPRGAERVGHAVVDVTLVPGAAHALAQLREVVRVLLPEAEAGHGRRHSRRHRRVDAAGPLIAVEHLHLAKGQDGGEAVRRADPHRHPHRLRPKGGIRELQVLEAVADGVLRPLPRGVRAGVPDADLKVLQLRVAAHVLQPALHVAVVDPHVPHVLLDEEVDGPPGLQLPVGARAHRPARALAAVRRARREPRVLRVVPPAARLVRGRPQRQRGAPGERVRQVQQPRVRPQRARTVRGVDERVLSEGHRVPELPGGEQLGAKGPRLLERQVAVVAQLEEEDVRLPFGGGGAWGGGERGGAPAAAHAEGSVEVPVAEDKHVALQVRLD
eukprot:376127-Prorocentrum_minimum.AAC.2